MALPLNKKIPFLTRIAVPPFSQQLGIFYLKKPENPARILDVIPKQFRQVVLQCNEDNGLLMHPEFNLEAKPNYVLSLDRDISELRKAYAKRLKANLKNAAKHPMVIRKIPWETFVKYYLTLTDQQIKVDKTFENRLSAVVKGLVDRNFGHIWAVFHNETMLSTCLLTLFNNRLTYLMARSTAEGKSKNAMHFLLDHLIEKHAGGKAILDFEGSSIPGLAHFFKSFGAEKREYALLKRRSFPF